MIVACYRLNHTIGINIRKHNMKTYKNRMLNILSFDMFRYRCQSMALKSFIWYQPC